MYTVLLYLRNRYILLDIFNIKYFILNILDILSFAMLPSACEYRKLLNNFPRLKFIRKEAYNCC